MSEITLSGAEEDSGEAGDDLLDLVGMIGNKVDFLSTIHHLARHLPFYILASHPLLAVMHTILDPMMAAYVQAPSTTSTGGAAVASSFNFTKAAEMRAAAMQRQSVASPASATMQAVQPGIEPGMGLPRKSVGEKAGPPAQPAASVSGAAQVLVTRSGSAQGAGDGASPLQVGSGAAAGVQLTVAQLC